MARKFKYFCRQNSKLEVFWKFTVQNIFAILGGWIGFEPFIVDTKIAETEDTTSFFLKRANGQPLPPFKAGQYLSLKFPKNSIPNIPYDTLRNYSLSCGENSQRFQITVKKEFTGEIPGLISHFLHNNVQEGDEVLF